MSKKFSILTACYNDKPYLGNLIKSVLAQDSPDWEWIIVDDCSSDGSWEMLRRIQNSNIKVLKNDQRLQCSSTYARALSESNGEFCGVLDADDALAWDAVKTILKRYKAHTDLSFIYTQHSWCDKRLRKQRKGLSSLPPDGLSIVEAATKRKHCFSHWRTFKRSAVDDINFVFPAGLEVAVDKHMGFALEELGPGAFFPRELYLYRYYKGNMSLTRAGDQKKTWLTLAKEYDARRRKCGIKAHPIRIIK